MKKNVAIGSTGMLVGAVLTAILNLNIFVRTEELARMETKMYQQFVQKSELREYLERFDKRLDSIDKKMDKLQEH